MTDSTPTPEPNPGRRIDDARTSAGLHRHFVDALGWIITALWAVSFGMEALVKGYSPPATIHALMMVVAGAAFGSTLIKKSGE